MIQILSKVLNVSLIYAAFRAATPIIYAALCAAITQQANILNIGTEGIMLVGAFFAVTVSYFTHSWVLAIAAAMLAGIIIAMIMAVGHIKYGADICGIGMGINMLALAITKAANNLPTAPPRPTMAGKLSLRTASGKVSIVPADITYISADGNYSLLCTFSNKEQVLESMSALEQLLDPTTFVRIDRSTIVNLQRVYKVNVKRHICTFISTAGTVMETELSKIGIDRLMQYM